MALMPIEYQIVYFMALGMVSYVGVRMVQWAENTTDLGYGTMVRFVTKNKTGKSGSCRCIGFKLKKTCRHITV